MRFLRILPAVWAMISWPFCRRTRKVALGSNSLTVPSNSSNSSLAIRPQLVLRQGREIALKPGKIKEFEGYPPGIGQKNAPKWRNTHLCLYPIPVVTALSPEFRGNLALQPIPDGAIGGFALFVAAFDLGGIGGLPIFDPRRAAAGMLFGFLGQGHHQIEILAGEFLEATRMMVTQRDAQFGHHLDRHGIELAGMHAGGFHIEVAALEMAQQPGRHGRTHRVHGADE